MAEQLNPEDIIAREGRLTPRGFRRWPTVTVANVEFDTLYGQLSVQIYNILRDYPPIRRQFEGTAAEIDNAIETGIDALINQALNELWNRLRIIAETHHRPTRTNVFTRKAPSSDGFMLPRFIASLLSGIGPLRITDTFRDTTIIYAPRQDYRDNFGREHPHPVDAYACQRMIAAMRAAGLPLAGIAQRGSTGAFFTTCSTRFEDHDTFEVVGAFHYSHYNRNDIAMALLFGDADEEEFPFQNLFHTIGYVDDPLVIDAFVDIQPPAQGITIDGPARPVGGDFMINEFGLHRNEAAQNNDRRRGIYILGRGRERYYACSLARDLSDLEIQAILRHRLIHGPGAHVQHLEAEAAPPAAPAPPA